MKNKICALNFLLFFGVAGLFFAPYLEGEETDQEVPETYTVKKGDTLWDISGKFFKDSFKWPGIWQKNDYINNPDLIYPGNELLLRKMFLKKIPEPEKEKKVKAKPKKKIVKIKKKRIVSPAPSLLPKKVPVTDSSTYRTSGFIIQEDFKVGTIIDSPLDRTTLSKGDIVYTDLGPENNAFIGKKYSVYRKIKNVKHPVTGEDLGSLIEVTGMLELKEFVDGRSVALITKSYEEIARKDLITEYIDLEVPLIDPSKAPAEKNVQGYIVEAKGNKTSVGLGDIVYVDTGNNKGILPGDRLVAYRIKEETTGFFKKKVTFTYPKTVIGELKIISTKQETATALVIKSIQELDIGEKVEYKLSKKK